MRLCCTLVHNCEPLRWPIWLRELRVVNVESACKVDTEKVPFIVEPELRIPLRLIPPTEEIKKL